MLSELLSDDQPKDAEFVPRATCYRCFRPTLLCYCDEVRPMTSSTEVIIVQHQREEFHPLNTARMVELGLTSTRLVRGSQRAIREALTRKPLPPGTALLFPSPSAVDLESLSPEERPRSVVVVDGTWDQAKTLLRLPELEGLPRVRFTPPSESEYRIRKEPKADYLSTIESVALVLEALEPGLDVEPLRALFRRVIDRNILARPGDTGQSRMKLRKKPVQFRFAEVLSDSGPSHVVYGEWATVRAPDGALMEAPLLLLVQQQGREKKLLKLLLRTPSPPHAQLLTHLGVSEEEFRERALDIEAATTLLREFVGTETMTAWGAGSVKLVKTLLPDSSVALLKGFYCDYRRFLGKLEKQSGEAPVSRWGGLSEVVEREGLGAVPVTLPRGERRLRESLLVDEWLRGLARGTNSGSEESE